jgi:hypothetical protein
VKVAQNRIFFLAHRDEKKFKYFPGTDQVHPRGAQGPAETERSDGEDRGGEHANQPNEARKGTSPPVFFVLQP